jgi:hypothetical protein
VCRGCINKLTMTVDIVLGIGNWESLDHAGAGLQANAACLAPGTLGTRRSKLQFAPTSHARNALNTDAHVALEIGEPPVR